MAFHLNHRFQLREKIPMGKIVAISSCYHHNCLLSQGDMSYQSVKEQENTRLTMQLFIVIIIVGYS